MVLASVIFGAPPSKPAVEKKKKKKAVSSHILPVNPLTRLNNIGMGKKMEGRELPWIMDTLG